MISSVRTLHRLLFANCSVSDAPWDQLTYERVMLLRDELLLDEKLHWRTVNKHLSILRGIFHAAWRMSRLTSEKYRRLIDIPPVVGTAVELGVGRSLAPDEIQALLFTCEIDPRSVGVRDGAMISLLTTTGVRISELLSLTVADWRDHTLHVRHGKRRKYRTIPVTAATEAWLQRYLQLRGDDGEPRLFPIREESVRRALAKRCRESDVKPATPHDFRRTFITSLLAAGVDVLLVKRLAGHSSANTTALYDRRGDEAGVAAVAKAFG